MKCIRSSLPIAAFLLAAGAGIAAPSAHAEQMLAWVSNSTTSTYINPPETALKLTDAGATALEFNTVKANEWVMISVSLSSSVFDVTDVALVYKVFVDGATASPNALTTASFGVAGKTIEQSNTFNFFFKVPAVGAHNMAVDWATSGGAVPLVSIYASSVSVTRLP